MGNPQLLTLGASEDVFTKKPVKQLLSELQPAQLK